MKKAVVIVISFGLCAALVSCDKTEGSFVLRAPVSEESSLIPSSDKSTPISSSNSGSSLNNSSEQKSSSVTSSERSSAYSSTFSSAQSSSSINSSSFSSSDYSSSTNNNTSQRSSIQPIMSVEIPISGHLDTGFHYYDVINPAADKHFDYQNPNDTYVIFKNDGRSTYNVSFYESFGYQILAFFDAIELNNWLSIIDEQVIDFENYISNGIYFEVFYHYVGSTTQFTAAVVHMYVTLDGAFEFIDGTNSRLYYTEPGVINCNQLKQIIQERSGFYEEPQVEEGEQAMIGED